MNWYPKKSKSTKKRNKNFSPTAQNDNINTQNNKIEFENKNTESKNNSTESTTQWIENFTQNFREFIDSKYKEHFSPEQILGYIYAVLFHKDYREKYLDFLKIDFPKIPFVESKEKFLALSDLGLELLNTHLMTDITEREREQKMMRMTCNIGLNVARQYKISGSWQCVIATNTLVDLSLMGSGNTGAGTIFPLYLYKEA